MDSEFVEEFDTDSGEDECSMSEDHCETLVKRFKLSESADYIPIITQANYSQWGPSYSYPPMIPSQLEHFAPIAASYPTSSTNVCEFSDSGLVPHKFQKADKPRRRRKHVRLSDFDDSIKTHAWRIFEESTLRKNLEKIKDKQEIKKINQRLEKIRKDSFNSICTVEDQSSIAKVVKGIKSQRRKRVREKALKVARSKEKQKNKELANIRNAEIEKWLEEQKNTFDKQRQGQLFFQEAKKSLSEVIKKKEAVEERLKLLSTIQKLRDVRKKQMMNTRVGFKSALSSSSSSGGAFSSGISRLTEKAQEALSQVKEEENMIRLMSQSEEKKVQGIVVTQTGDSCSNETEDTLKLKRDRKWQKYLRKRGLGVL